MRLAPKEYASRNEKIIDFSIGFLGWFIFNALAFGGAHLVASFFVRDVPSGPIGASPYFGQWLFVVGCAYAFPPLFNLAFLIRFVRSRYWIALGGLAAFGLALLAVVCIGTAALGGVWNLLNQNAHTDFGP
jgi:hypothetical protein